MTASARDSKAAGQMEAPTLWAKELLRQFQEKWAECPPSAVHLIALDEPKYTPLGLSSETTAPPGSLTMWLVPPEDATDSEVAEFLTTLPEPVRKKCKFSRSSERATIFERLPVQARRASFVMDHGIGRFCINNEVSEHACFLLGIGAKAHLAHDFQKLARQAGALVAGVSLKGIAFHCYDDPIMNWFGYLLWGLSDSKFVSRGADHWSIENVFAASVEMLKRFVASADARPEDQLPILRGKEIPSGASVVAQVQAQATNEPLIGDLERQQAEEAPAEKWEFIPGGFIYRRKQYDLSGQPLRLLQCFASARFRTLTHQQIIEGVWGDAYSPSDGRVRGLVSELRNALRELLNLCSDPLPSVGASAWRLELR